MGPSARWILIHNDVHINALDDTFGCAEGLVRTFIARPGWAEDHDGLVRQAHP